MAWVNKTSTSRQRIFDVDQALSRRSRLSYPDLVLQLQPGGHKLALERLNASATSPQLAPHAPRGDPGGSGSADKAREQQQQDEKIERQVDQER
jgi:hypothetical protein